MHAFDHVIKITDTCPKLSWEIVFCMHFSSKAPHFQPSTQLLYKVTISKSLIFSFCMFELICSQLPVLYCMPQYVLGKEYQRQAEEGVWLDPNCILGVEVKCLSGQEGNEQQYPLWAVFNLNRSYRVAGYTLTSVRETQTEDGTMNTGIICRDSGHGLFSG